MLLSRVTISNFRNFKELDVALGRHAVVLGENKVGKTNLLFALRLILDPALPDSARRLRLDDFWDGLPRPLAATDAIEISAEFSDFEDSEALLAVLADHLIQPLPMVAKVTFRFQPIAGLGRAPRSEADYEFVLFGGDRPENTVGYELRRWMPMDLFPALRDAESDLARWTRSPLRPLLDRAAQTIDEDNLKAICWRSSSNDFEDCCVARTGRSGGAGQRPVGWDDGGRACDSDRSRLRPNRSRTIAACPADDD